MYSRILVPLDGSDLAEQALPYAVALADVLDSPVVLLRVPENIHPLGHDDFDFSSSLQGMSAEDLKKESVDYLDGVASRLRNQGLKVSAKVRTGEAADLIVEEAAFEEDTIVIMASRGRSGIARWVMGSVADAVLRGVEGPLLLVRPVDGPALEEPTIDRILLPLDGSELAEQVLPHADLLAKKLKIGVDLVRVTPSAREYHRSTVFHPVGGVPINYYPPYEEFVRSEDIVAQIYVDDIKRSLETMGIPSVDSYVTHGDPAAAISDVARGVSGTLVVIATHGRSGIGRWVLGSVADSVVRHSGCPVLLVRARGPD